MREQPASTVVQTDEEFRAWAAAQGWDAAAIDEAVLQRWETKEKVQAAYDRHEQSKRVFPEPE